MTLKHSWNFYAYTILNLFLHNPKLVGENEVTISFIAGEKHRKTFPDSVGSIISLILKRKYHLIGIDIENIEVEVILKSEERASVQIPLESITGITGYGINITNKSIIEKPKKPLERQQAIEEIETCITNLRKISLDLEAQQKEIDVFNDNVGATIVEIEDENSEE